MAMSALEESLVIWQELEPGIKERANTLKNLWLLFHESNVSSDKEERIAPVPPPLPSL